MFRLTHRRCRQENEGLADTVHQFTERATEQELVIDHLAAAARSQTERADDLAERLRDEEMYSGHLAQEIRYACDDAEYAREDAVIPEYLREQLLNAHDRAHVLSEHADALERIGEYEKAEGTLQARRRRAAEHALGGAWCGPSHDSSHGRALVCQALLALPLESYDVEVTYVYDDGEWTWFVDGRRVNTNTGFALTSEVDVLIGRYGLTRDELDTISAQAQRARRTAA